MSEDLRYRHALEAGLAILDYLETEPSAPKHRAVARTIYRIVEAMEAYDAAAASASANPTANADPDPRRAAFRMARGCRRVVQACLREEEWRDADEEFTNVILQGLTEFVRDRDGGDITAIMGAER